MKKFNPVGTPSNEAIMENAGKKLFQLKELKIINIKKIKNDFKS